MQIGDHVATPNGRAGTIYAVYGTGLTARFDVSYDDDQLITPSRPGEYPSDFWINGIYAADALALID